MPPLGLLTPTLVLVWFSAEVPSCHSVYLRQDGYLAHANRTEGTSVWISWCCFVLSLTSSDPFVSCYLKAACLTKWRGISTTIPAWYQRRSKVSPALETEDFSHFQLQTDCFMWCRWHQARGRAVPRGPVVPAPRLAAAMAVPGGSAGRPVQLPLHRLDRPRDGVQTHRARRGEKLICRSCSKTHVLFYFMNFYYNFNMYIVQGHLNTKLNYCNSLLS